MESFTDWLNNELEKHGWSRSEASRRGEISSSMFDKVIGGFANPGPDFLDGVARAFNLTRRQVYARAGLIEPEPDENESKNKAMLYEFARLSLEEQNHLLKEARALNAYRTRTDSQPVGGDS